jgi:hypothetical protein
VRPYLREFAAACSCAIERNGARTRLLRLGDTAIRLRFAGPALLPYAAPLAHRFDQADPEQPPRLTIELWDAESAGVLPPPFLCHDVHPPARGEIRRYPEDEVRIQFTSGVRPHDGALTAVTVFDERAAVILSFFSAPDRIPW